MSHSRPRLGLTGQRGVLGRCLQQEWTGVEWVPFPGDIRDYPAVQKWIAESGRLDGIIHLAAMVPIQKVEAQLQAAFQTNAGGTCNLLDALREAATPETPAPWVFLGSTSHIYASSTQALTEDAPISPVSLYGFTKWQAEELGAMYAKKYGMPICLGRIFSYSSALQPPSYFIPSLIAKIQAAAPGATLEIPGLHGIRDFVSTRQICEAIRFLFEKSATGSINIASGVPTKLLDIALLVKEKLGRPDVTIHAPEVGTAILFADTSRLAGMGLKLPTEMNDLIDEVLAAQTSL